MQKKMAKITDSMNFWKELAFLKSNFTEAKLTELENKISNDKICGITPFWGDTSFAGGMREFSDYVVDLLIQNDQNSTLIREIFTYIEFLIINGDEDVKDVVTTCFLENILNLTPRKIDPKRYVTYLGSESREYCRAWDKFTGVKTEGL